MKFGIIWILVATSVGRFELVGLEMGSRSLTSPLFICLETIPG